MLAALEQWPTSGVPDKPGAWLMTVAQRRAVDHHRRAERHARTQTRLAHELLIGQEDLHMADTASQVDAVEDDALRLMLLTCHPALTVESQVALTLRLVGGSPPGRSLARCWCRRRPSCGASPAPRPPRAARPQRRPRRLAARPPDPAERRRRLPGRHERRLPDLHRGLRRHQRRRLARPELCHDALRLARLLTALAPDEPEAHGLLALMELQSSRGAARTDGTGALVLLEQQDRSHWDQLAIRRGCDALGRALAAGPPGPYALQAAIAACHARASSVAETDWTSIAGLYDALARLTASPVVLLNRAVAHSRSVGPAVGLQLLDELADAPGLRDSHLLPSVRGDLLVRLGRTDAARREFERAADLTGNARERAFLLDRARSARS
jgi:predicted RNA polymerase sigma factor